jgi:CheY-like chemotaxis protein
MSSILIIDDESDVRDGMKRVLDRAGFAVRAIDDPMDAVAELTRVSADLVITDMIMPRVNGADVIDAIVKNFPTVRILAISGGGNFDVTSHEPGEMVTTAYLTAAKNAGAHLVLAKPFDSAELLRAVEAAMNAGRADRG